MRWFWVVRGVLAATLDGKWAGRWMSPLHFNNVGWVAGYAGSLCLEGT